MSALLATTSTSVLPDAGRWIGAVVAASVAGGALVSREARVRAIAVLAALVLMPVLLLLEIWHSPQLEIVRAHPLLAVVGAAVALGVVGAVAVLMTRKSWLLPGLLVLALPFRVPIEAGGETANLLVPLYFVIAAGAIAWAVPRLRRSDAVPDRRRLRKVEWLLAAGVVVYGVQSLYSLDTEKALEQLIFFYVPFSVLFVLLRDVEWSEKLLARCFSVLVGLGIAFVAVAVWEFQARELLLNPKVINSNEFQEFFRVNSLFFFDPNMYGRFLALVLIGLGVGVLWEKRVRTLAGVVAATVVLWGGLLLSLSQSSFVMLIVGLLIVAALKFGARRVVLPVVGLASVSVVVVLALPSVTGVNFGSKRSLNNATSGRFALVRGGIDLAKERPIFGWGAGAFAKAYRSHQRTSGPRAVSASHTIPVTVAAEQGMLGLALYLALLAAALAALLRHCSDNRFRVGIAAAFIAVVIHTWAYAAFLEDPTVWALLGVGVALAAVPRSRRRRPEVTVTESPAPQAVPIGAR